jgi:hypothetical protein
MQTGQAHYSVLVLPPLIIAAAVGFRRIPSGVPLKLACGLLVASSLSAYRLGGAGPLAVTYAPATVTVHANRVAALIASLPAEASVSASSALVPRLSQRARVYVFPALENADYVFLDLKSSAAPTSPGDVFLRTRQLLEAGGWDVDRAEDGLLLLRRDDDAGTIDFDDVARRLSRRDEGTSPIEPGDARAPELEPAMSYADGAVRLLGAILEPADDGATDVDGPRWILRTVWLPMRQLSPGTRLAFTVVLGDGTHLDVADASDLWWNPPSRWPVGQPTTIEIPNIPARQFASWQATFS